MSNMRKFIQAAKQANNTDNQQTINTDNQIAGLPDNQQTINTDNQITRLPDEKMVNLCVRVPESMRRHWAAEAKRTGVTMTEVIMDALNQKFGLPDNQ